MIHEPAPDAHGVTVRRRIRAGFDGLFPVLYGLAYASLGIVLQLRFFPIGDLDLETDFYADLVIAARNLAAGQPSVHDFMWKGPVYAAVLVPIQELLGDWYRAAVVLSAVAAGVSLLIAYRLVLRLFDRRTAVATIVGTSLVVELFVQSHRATTDVLFLLLVLASMASTLPAGRSIRRHAAAGGLAALAFLTRYNGAFLVAGTLLFLLFVNPDRLGRRDRARALAAYTGVFLLVTLPWFVASALEGGQFLATRNAENVMAAFFGEPRWQAEVTAHDGSLRALVAAHPGHVLARYVVNLIGHARQMLHGLLEWPLAIVPIAGVVGLVLLPPTRMQAGLYLFAAVYWLLMGVVFYAPRFFLPMIPAAMALGFALLRGSGSASGRSGISSRRLAVLPKQVTLGLLAIVICTLAIVQIRRIVAAEHQIYAARPLYILDAARHLAAREESPGARIMARKGHIAYHAGLDFSLYSTGIATLEDLVRKAHSECARYIVYSKVEYSMLPRMLFLAVSDTVPHLKEVHRGEGIRVFSPEPGQPVLSEAERYELLLASLRAARSQNRPAAIHTALLDLGVHEMTQLQFEPAAARFREAVEVAERGDGRNALPWQAAVAREHLAGVEMQLGAPGSAVANLQKNADFFASLGARRDVERTDAMLRQARSALGSGLPGSPEKP